MEKLKIMVTNGYENEFMQHCKSNDIQCKQYPIEVLKTRFSVMGTRDLFNNLPYILNIEQMPTVILD